jgi:branched-chain amino acid aminotransferase
VFAIKGNKLMTPPTWCGGLEGITRDKVMQVASEMGMDVSETVMTRYELWTADEVFLTGTAAEVIAVVDIDRRPIGAGTPGPVTKKLGQAYRKLAGADGVKIA